MSISVITNFDVNTSANIDARLGPYVSIEHATSSIPEISRYAGMTVIITGSGALLEYWFYPTTASTDLRQKSSFPFTGSAIITGSLTVTGAVYFPSLVTSSTVGNIVMYGANGQLFVTSSSAIGGSSNLSGLGVLGQIPVWSQTYVLGNSGITNIVDLYDPSKTYTGIDTSNPTHSLDIIGNFKISGSSTTSASINHGDATITYPLNQTIVTKTSNSDLISFYLTESFYSSTQYRSLIFNYHAELSSSLYSSIASRSGTLKSSILYIDVNNYKFQTIENTTPEFLREDLIDVYPNDSLENVYFKLTASANADEVILKCYNSNANTDVTIRGEYKLLNY